MTRRIYTVGQVNRYLKRLFWQDGLLASLEVSGEVSNLKYHSSGHIYFSLKDQTGALSCVMFAGSRRGLAFPMKNGDQVVVSGNIDYYERDGRCQLYAKRITLAGAGLLYERFLRLKEELESRGMFAEQYKKPIPRYARRIGVVTAPTGEVIHDIGNVAARRNPYVEILLCPALVQGAGAAESICRGIRRLDGKVDVIIVGRGGGSIEDLWPFNEESVAQAIFDCGTPVISAVGHETDTTIADYVADLRAPTPSAAAELAVFDFRAFAGTLDSYRTALNRGVSRRLEAARQRIRWAGLVLARSAPDRRLRDARLRADECADALTGALSGRIGAAETRAEAVRNEMRAVMKSRLSSAFERSEAIRRTLDQDVRSSLLKADRRLALLAGRFHGISPLARLRQGYAFAETEDGRAVTGIGGLRRGDALRLYMSDGLVHTEITGTEAVPWISESQSEDRSDEERRTGHGIGTNEAGGDGALG